MNLACTVASCRGLVKQRNEDSIAIGTLIGTSVEIVPTWLKIDSPQPTLCCVADGLGGHAEGQIASGLAVQRLASCADTLTSEQAIVNALATANADIFADMAEHQARRGMGTTVAGLVFHDGAVTSFNVGDSRCFKLMDGCLVQLSTDDSPPPMPGQPAAAVVTVVTQVLGGHHQVERLDAHLHCSEAVPGDRYLVCSDGVTDYVPLDALEQALECRGVPAVTAIVEACLSAGAPDNVSVLVIDVFPSPVPFGSQQEEQPR